MLERRGKEEGREGGSLVLGCVFATGGSGEQNFCERERRRSGACFKVHGYIHREITRTES